MVFAATIMSFTGCLKKTWKPMLMWKFTEINTENCQLCADYSLSDLPINNKNIFSKDLIFKSSSLFMASFI